MSDLPFRWDGDHAAVWNPKGLRAPGRSFQESRLSATTPDPSDNIPQQARPAASRRLLASAPKTGHNMIGRHLERMIHEVKDLSPDQKLAVESLLGRPVSEQETVSVQAFQPPAVSVQRRQEITEALRRYFAEVDAKRQPVSADAAGGIIDEAMRDSRPGYRPRQ